MRPSQATIEVIAGGDELSDRGFAGEFSGLDQHIMHADRPVGAVTHAVDVGLV